eukprot:4360229-Lingulodinium_polyedra.AAC.1
MLSLPLVLFARVVARAVVAAIVDVAVAVDVFTPDIVAIAVVVVVEGASRCVWRRVLLLSL